MQSTFSVVWAAWSTVCCLATKPDDNAQAYHPWLLSVGQSVKVCSPCSFLLCLPRVTFLSRNSWVLLRFSNLFLSHQQRLMYPLLTGGYYWVFLLHTELISSCGSVSLEVKRRGDLGNYSESYSCRVRVGDETAEMTFCVILLQL